MLRAGLIGLSNTGKTTLFQLLTRATEPAASSKARRGAALGMAAVPDGRLHQLTQLFKPKKEVAATVAIADTAGAEGANSLVDVTAYREADALLHVVRAFRAPDIPHPAGSIDPGRDARAMEDELILADLAIAERRLDRLAKDAKKGLTKSLELEAETLQHCRAALEGGTPIRALPLAQEAAKTLRGFQFLSAKPLLLVINLDESDIDQVERAVELTDLTEMLSHTMTRAVPVCAKIELEIAQLEPADARVFLADLGLGEPGIDRVIRAAYDLLGYVSFFTVGDDECRAWSIPNGTLARAAAGEIHSDIERGFIRAEVVTHSALLARGSLHACRDHGELRLEGKDYVVQDGDVINFRFAT